MQSAMRLGSLGLQITVNQVPTQVRTHTQTYALSFSFSHTIPYHTIPYHTKTYHTIPYHTIPYHTIPYHTIPYHTIPYHTIPYHTIPYHTIPYHTIPYHTIPYHTIPYLTLPYLSFPYLTWIPYLTYHWHMLSTLFPWVKSKYDHSWYPQQTVYAPIYYFARIYIFEMTCFLFDKNIYWNHTTVKQPVYCKSG